MKQGYKQSPLGIIPEDWEVKRLKETGEIYSGGTPSTDIQEYWNGNIDWCTPTDITSLNGAMYINKTAQKITENGLKNSSAVLMPPNSIIVCTRATIGNAAISLHQISTNQGFKNIVPNKDIDFIFLYYTIINNKTRLIRLGNGSTFLEVSKSDFENLTIPVPPLPEQHRIVSVLSLWDTAISKQAALIEKLTIRKRGLMQQLLIGKKRLKGFEVEWKEVRLGEICEIVTGKLDANAMVNNGTYPFYTCAKEIYRINEYAFDTEALLVSGNGEYVGYVHYYKGKFNAYQRTYVLDKFLENIFFLYYALNQYLPKRILRTKSNSNTPYIVMETLANMELLLPENNEQKAIASILINADKEIEIAKEKLLHLQEEKRGLMQVLLTGKKRVK